jgi:hypothetical protein
MLLRAECKPILRIKILESSEEIDFFEIAIKKHLFKSLIFLSLENLKIKDNKVEIYL